jgi:hypothetical protein
LNLILRGTSVQLTIFRLSKSSFDGQQTLEVTVMSSNARETKPKRSGALGRLTTVMGSIRPTFERRQRLRHCLIQAGAENLPDYELLQVMLFTSNPHADVEVLVEELLDRFGSLAEVMSADTEALAAAGLSLPAIGEVCPRGGPTISAGRLASAGGGRVMGQIDRLLQRPNRIQQG